MEKEWVLKGALTTDNKDTGIAVDFSGCTELIVVGTAIVTSNASLRTQLGWFIPNLFTTSLTYHRGVFEDVLNGYICKSCKSGSNGTLSANVTPYEQVNYNL